MNEPTSSDLETKVSFFASSYPTSTSPYTQTQDVNGDLFSIPLTSNDSSVSAPRSQLPSPLQQNASQAYHTTFPRLRTATVHVRTASLTTYKAVLPHFIPVIHGSFRAPLRSDIIVGIVEFLIFNILRGIRCLFGYTGLVALAVAGVCAAAYLGFVYGYHELDNASVRTKHSHEDDDSDFDSEDGDDKKIPDPSIEDGILSSDILAFPRYTNLRTEHVRPDARPAERSWTWRDGKKIFKYWALPIARSTVNFFLVVPIFVTGTPVVLVYFGAWKVGRAIRARRSPRRGDVEEDLGKEKDIEKEGDGEVERGRKARLDSVQDPVAAL
ncbi:hypothetical protein P280DRAFT_522433 [Massarina eburnea CBS 473.64]|uniref:Uncharacterized protein n=1 Tax=Massarina eburnea CBS 473.64 TaxID=1395130 RepID=A0A6A6RKT6_9PLEO|nr:hypothetical protein P280DRAFT_522433 [Massarina eburnea CBS 473.64]